MDDKQNKKDISSLQDIIQLEEFGIYFLAPYNGFLYVAADEFNIKFTDTILSVKGNLNKFYIEQLQCFIISDFKNLTSIRFEKLEEKDIKNKISLDKVPKTLDQYHNSLIKYK